MPGLAAAWMLTTMGAGGTARPDEARSARAMGATIRALRDHAHLSQIALGERISLHQNYIGAIERGEIRSPGLVTLDRIARGLGVSIAVFATSYVTPPDVRALRIDATAGRSRGGETHDPEALGHAIRVVRRRLKLTQDQLGAAIDMHRSHIGAIENGEKANPRIATIARIASGLTAKLGPDEPSLLPLFAQTFTGEKTVADVRATVDPKPSGSPGVRCVPQVGADT